MCERVDQIAVGVCLEALQGHGATGRIADELFQLIPPMRRNRRVGVEGKPVDTGAVRPREPGRLALRAKARADTAHRLASPFSEGDALLHGGRHGAGELRGGVAQGIIPGDHGSLQARFQVAQPAERADHPPADVLYHRCDSGMAGRLAREKAGLQAHGGALEVDTLYEDAMAMEVHIERTAKTLEKRDRARVDGGARVTALDRLVDVILPDGGANDRMDRGG